MSLASLRPRHMLIQRFVVRRPAHTSDGQGGFTDTMPQLDDVRGRLAMMPGQRAMIDPVTGKLIAFTTATAWLDALSFLGVRATRTIQDCKFTANDLGTGGNSITVAFLLPGTDGALSVSVSGNAITVTLQRTGGVSVSTAQQVVDAVNGNTNAAGLVTAHVSGTAATVQVAQSVLALTSGVNSTLPREGDEVVAPSGSVWNVLSAGEQNGLVQCQLVGKVV